MFDLVTKTEAEIECDFHKALTAHSLAIITMVTAVIAASHFWK
jgi:hypothetical protein